MVPYDIQELKRKVSGNNPRKIFLLYEGMVTEEYLINPLLSSNSIVRSNNIIFRKIEKLEGDTGITGPFALVKYARKIVVELTEKKMFAPGRDKIMIVFDLDVFKNNQDKMDELLSQKTSDMIFCYTNPAIELFMILSKPRAYELYIEPNKKEILENNKNENGERYVYSLAKKVLEIPTTKEGKKVDFRNIINNIDNALIQERFINNKLTKAANELTSNIAYVLKKLSNDDFDIEY